jgi:ribosomal 30S subunit maturation factor RimM
MYQGDDKKAAFAAGQFSADYGLKGVYKVFLMIATPQSLMKAAKRIIALYYQPVSVELDEIQKKSLVLSTTKLQKNSDLLDYRTIGWCVRALELANCKNVQHEKVEAKYPDMFSVKLSWD